jgi:branched-chain amino acid transport system ATP-binding protein
MLEGKKVTKRFGGLVAISELDFSVEKGQIVGLIGPNGSGKTTLFNVISGFYQPDGGTISFSGQNISGYKPWEIAKCGISRTFQLVRPFYGLTTFDNVMAGALFGKDPVDNKTLAKEQVLRLLQFMLLVEKKDLPAGSLTLAERKRLEIARALATKPQLILLDEVFSGLNEVEINEAIKLIFRMRDEFGLTVFIVEHVLKAIMETCDKVIVIHHGTKIAEGKPQEITDNPDVIEAYLGGNN